MSNDWIVAAELGMALVVAAFLLSVGFCSLARAYAPQLGFLDRPGGHKGHQIPTPLGGGVAIWLATILVISAGMIVAVSGRAWLPETVAGYIPGMMSRVGELGAILGLATVIMVMGLVDDRR